MKLRKFAKGLCNIWERYGIDISRPGPSGGALGQLGWDTTANLKPLKLYFIGWEGAISSCWKFIKGLCNIWEGSGVDIDGPGTSIGVLGQLGSDTTVNFKYFKILKPLKLYFIGRGGGRGRLAAGGSLLRVYVTYEAICR